MLRLLYQGLCESNNIPLVSSHCQAAAICCLSSPQVGQLYITLAISRDIRVVRRDCVEIPAEIIIHRILVATELPVQSD